MCIVLESLVWSHVSLVGWGIAVELIAEWLPGIGFSCESAYEAWVCKQFFFTKNLADRFAIVNHLDELGETISDSFIRACGRGPTKGT